MQYGEYITANFLKEKLKPCSVFIPCSAQEKGIDLVIGRFNGKTTKIQTIQVKTSRTYFPKNPNSEMCGYFWFNTFKIPENADWIIFVGIIPCSKNGENTISIKWKSVYLCMSNKEAKLFMENVKTKKGKPDRMFGFCFDVKGNFFQYRGNQDSDLKLINNFKIENKLDLINDRLN